MSYDVIVIGAGINGSTTAFDLAQRKRKVLLLEQFPLPHSRGSSHGQTRVIRCLYAQKIYAQMTLDSFPLWQEFERKGNEKLLIRNNMLQVFNKTDHSQIDQAKSILEDLQVSYDVLSKDEINEKYKPLHFQHDVTGICEYEGGTLMASKCVATVQKLFKEFGGELHDNEQVRGIVPGKECRIITNKGQYTTKSVVITAGPFASKLLKMLNLNLPLTIQRTHLCFWKLDNENEGTLEAGFPSFVCRPFNIYGQSSFEYPGLMKICQHGGPVVDIDYPDIEPDLEKQKTFIKKCTKGLSDTPSIIEGCLYTCTPDADFIIDTHPKYNNIVIGTGFSGTGFKMSPITGKILASLALGEESGYDLSLFKMNRFPNILKVNSQL